jgi:hypothetical protein
MAEESKIKYDNKQLVEKCRSLVRELSQSGGASWSLQVPVNFERDPDVLFNEIGNRLLKLEDALRGIAQCSDCGSQTAAIIVMKRIASEAIK